MEKNAKMTNNYSISVVIPAYNEADNIINTINIVVDTLKTLKVKWEIVVVNDGSNDETKVLVDNLKLKQDDLRIISHEKNRGYGAALKTGFSSAKNDYIILFPGDNQFYFSQVHYLIEASKDADIVAGYRVDRKDDLRRKINAFIFNTSVMLFFGLGIKDIDCGFKLYKKKVFDDIELSCDGALIDTEILCKTKQKGFRIKQVPLKHKARLHGDSTGGNSRVILRAINEFLRLWKECIFSKNR